jgi:hypothetical protein
MTWSSGRRAIAVTALSLVLVAVWLEPAQAVPYSLTVSKAGAGSGTVTSSPPGIACGSDCSESYEEGTFVTLSAVPDSGSYFAGWVGGSCSGTGTCTTQVNAETSITATFELQTPKSVSLKASDRRIDEGDRVTLKASVAPCGTHAGESVQLKFGGKTRSKASNSQCQAKWRLRLNKTTRFRAVSPQQDADHLTGTSKRVKVRVTPEPRASGGGGAGEGGGGGGGGEGGGCHPSYPDFCIPPPPPDLDCSDVSGSNFTVVGSDPHGFDGDGDGVGCES